MRRCGSPRRTAAVWPRGAAVPGPALPAAPLPFRALIDLERKSLDPDGRRYPLAPGMQVVAELHLGERSVLEYLLSPVRKAFHEAGRER